MTGPPPTSWAVDPTEAGAREVLPGLWRLRIPVGWEHFDHVNAYAIRREDGILLVDCGSGGDPSCELALESSLEAAGLHLGEVTALALTHAHTDHAGLAAFLRERGPITIYGHPDDAHVYAVLRDPREIQLRRARLARREGVPEARLEAFADVREELEGMSGIARPDRPLRDGVAVDSALGPWEAIETPGHAPSHVCLIQREHRVAIVGDLICAAFVPWLEYGWTPDPAGEMLRSLDRLDAVGPLDLALPGHGRPLTEVGEITAKHRAETALRIGTTQAALEAGPATAYELADRTLAIDAAPDIDAVGHLGETLSYLRLLHHQGAVTRTVGEAGNHLYELS